MASPVAAGSHLLPFPESDEGSSTAAAVVIFNNEHPQGAGSRPGAILGEGYGYGVEGIAEDGGGIGVIGIGYGKASIGVEGSVNDDESSSAVYGVNNGNGYAGHFVMLGKSSNAASSALYVENPGGLTSTSGDYGTAATFTIANASNTADAVSATTAGTGTAIYAENTNAKGGAAGVFLTTNKNNEYAALQAESASSKAAAILGQTASGTGVQGNATTAGGTAVDGLSTGGGNGVIGEITGGGSAILGRSDDGSGYSGFFSGGSGGSNQCYYKGAPTWSCVNPADAMKEAAAPNHAELLERLDAMPVNYYSLKAARVPGVRYLGPSGEDFRAAFDLGDDDNSIADGNAYGVALAAAQGLYRKLKADEAEIADLKAENLAMKQTLADQQVAWARAAANEERLARLEAAMTRITEAALVQEAAR